MKKLIEWIKSLFNISTAVRLPHAIDLVMLHQHKKKDVKLSSVHALNRGAILVASYDSDSRSDAWLHVLLPSGEMKLVYDNVHAETYGHGDRVGEWIYLPAEDKDAPVIRVNVNTYNVEMMPHKQPHEYGARQVGGLCAYIPRGQGNKINQLYDMVKGVFTGQTFPALKGIVSGMVIKGDEVICSVIDYGIQSSRGWHINVGCPELATIGKDTIAFLRNGDIHKLDGAQLGYKIAATSIKPLRATTLRKIMYWVTMHPTTVWATDCSKARRIHHFGDKEENPNTQSSLFGTSIANDGESLIIGRSIEGGGFEIWRGKTK
jgi:hypothetical protein